MRATLVLSLLALAAGTHVARAGETGVTGDSLQAPALAAPQRGSLVGTYAGVRGEAADLGRGVFALPAPFTAPEERGPLLAPVFPTYASERGLSEFGMGWAADLAIERWRGRGDLDFATDDLLSPWGRLVGGVGGVYGPAGLAHKAIVIPSADGRSLTAYLGDGTRWRFGGDPSATVDVPGRGVAAWQLVEVVDREGHVTTLAWTANPSGRPFLTSIVYGGYAAAAPAYRIDLHYEVLPAAMPAFTTGRELDLDRRVDTISTYAIAPGGESHLRWRYALAYTTEAPAPAFYLASVTRTFASGATAPAVRYTYGSAVTALGSAAFTPDPAIDELFAQLGGDATDPSRNAFVDADQDGRLDIEDHASNTLYRRTDDHYVTEPLAPPGADVSPACRPSAFGWPDVAPPRALVRLAPGAAPVRVVAFEPGDWETTIDVCTREGTLISRDTVAGDFTPGPRTHLVDMNRDEIPDLVAVAAGQVTIVEGTVAVDATWHPGASHAIAIAPDTIDPSVAWIQDLNGDGIADVATETSDGIVVWYGTGHFGLAPDAHAFPIVNELGWDLPDLSGYSVSFVDANHDGLADLLLTSTDGSGLFLDAGDHFQGVAVPGLAAPTIAQGAPVVADLGGRGGAGLHAVRDGSAQVLALDAPAVGLLIRADDGYGTQLEMTYEWAPAVPGVAWRRAVLAGLTSTAPGRAPTTATYTYEGPRRHTLDDYLLGYDAVTRSDERGSTRVELLNEDRYAGILLASIDREINEPQLERVEQRTYDDDAYQGIAWPRPATTTTGWRRIGSADVVGTDATYAAYDGVCPTLLVEHDGGTTLTTELTRAAPAALALYPHCLWSTIAESAHHADARFDFTSTRTFTRDALGFATEIRDAADGDVLVQRATYDDAHRILSVTAPGTGTTTATYDALGLIATVTQPDGMRTMVLRDPATTAPIVLATDHGTLWRTQFFIYDGFERLAGHWDDSGRSSVLAPLERFEYREATHDQPAAIETTTLVDPAGTYETTIDLATPAGDPIATASLGPAGWAFGPIVRRDQAGAHVTSRRSADALAGSPLDLDDAALAALGAPLSDHRIGFAGEHSLADDLVEGSIHHVVTLELDIDDIAGVLVRTMREAGAITATDQLDPARRVVAHTAAGGERQQYRYDARGRLRDIQLEDGKHHTVRYDGLGRIVAIVRDGISTVQRAYVPGTRLVATETRLGSDGLAAAATAYTYDNAGRVVTETATDLATGTVDHLHWYHDGASPEAPDAHPTPGLLGAVTGDGFVKRYTYRPDGTVARRIVELDDWRVIDIAEDVWTDGRPRTRTVRVSDADGHELRAYHVGFGHDNFGRDTDVSIDDQPVAALQLDADGTAISADLSGSGQLVFVRDPITRTILGTTHVDGSWQLAEELHRDARGLPSWEALTTGGVTDRRDYQFDPRGLLVSSASGETAWTYGYDAAGLVNSATERDDAPITIDSLGRVTARGDLTLVYGARDQIARATRGATVATYAYDEAGDRLLRRVGGARQAFAEGIYVDDTTVVELVRVAGRIVGAVQDGAFRPLATDVRDSIVADIGGPAAWPAPYGARGALRPSLGAVLDFATGRWDDVLETERLGVRDYDPKLQRFWTPDPVFLAEPERCVASPLECNLYGYANGNPVALLDPTGSQAVPKSPADRGWSGWLDTSPPKPKFELSYGRTAGYRKEISTTQPGATPRPAEMRASSPSVRAEVSASWFKAGGGGSWGSRQAHHLSVDLNLTGPAAKGGFQANERAVTAGGELRLFKAELSAEGCFYACAKAAVSVQLGLALVFRFENGHVVIEVGAAVVGAKISVGVEDSVWNKLEKAAADALRSEHELLFGTGSGSEAP